MKQITDQYKESLLKLGREYDIKVTYGNTTLTNEQLNEVTPHYRADLLKSVMKQLDLDSNVEIPIGTEINCQFGLKVGNNYEYIDYGNYIVYSSEKQEDLLSYRIVCYDKMLYAMKDYEDLEITYPISIKDYIIAIATKIGLEFDDEDFTNADKEIPEEKYLDEDGNTLGYTYRDVLDELAQVTASIIKVEDNKLRITYPDDVIAETSIFENTSGQITTDSKKVLDLEVEGNTYQEQTPTPTNPQEIQVVTGNQEIEVCGKNLANIDDIKIGKSWSGSNKGQRATILFIPVQRNQTYSFSSSYTNTHITQIRWVFNGGPGSALNAVPPSPYNNTSYDYVSIEVMADTTFTSDMLDGVKIMFNKGNTALPYEPYIGNTYPIYLGAKNLWNWTPSTITLVKSTSRYINIYPTSSITLKAGTYNLCFPDLELNNNNYDLYVQMVGVENAGLALNNKNRTFTINEEKTLTRLYVFLSSSDSDSATATFSQIQITKGSDPQKVSDNPIELCKINTYQDRIFKGKGYNLFDKANVSWYRNASGAFEDTTDTLTDRIRTSSFQFKGGGNYIVSGLPSGISLLRVRTYKETTDWGTDIIPTDNKFELDEDVNYIHLLFSGSNFTSATNTLMANANIQIQEGSNVLPYEPYLAKGKWYIEKNIGKVVLDGSEGYWQVVNSGTPNYIYLTYLGNFKPITTGGYSNYYPYKTIGGSDTNQGIFAVTDYVRIRWGAEDTIANFKIWLSTHNTILYYLLATPTYTEITNEELISQLNSIELLDGLNNISITSANLSSPLKISYISEYETITEDYLKDVNVNFSEKFGPINSLVLSRSADSDLIYRKDDSSIEKNGLTEIKISDNQILNGNDRDEYIDNIFNRLKGIEYYTNDYDSTGITYLELGDFYKVEARGNRYLALMLNDELNVTQGFEELIHTDKPETSVSDYKKADTTDRRINQATLIVDKQNQTIQALTSRTSNLESKQINDKAELLAKFGDYALDSRVDDITTQVETLQTDTYTKTEVKSILKGTFYDSDNNQIVSEVVKTTSGTFDENGMHYEKTNAKTKSTINEVGVRVDNAINDSELLFAGYDDNINQTIVRTDNLTVRNFLVVGSQSRFQDYEENNEQGTGVFDL